MLKSTCERKNGLFATHIIQKTCDIRMFERNWQKSWISSKFDNAMLIAHFSAEPTETTVYDLCEIYNLANLVKKKHVLKTQVN